MSNTQPWIEVYTTPSATPIAKLPFNSQGKLGSQTLKDILQRQNFAPSGPASPQKTLKLSVITHGYASGIRKEGESFMQIKDAILSLNNETLHVVVMLDWSPYAGKSFVDYGKAVENIPVVAEWIAKELKEVRDTWKGSLVIHGIGFSLGAHLLGTAGLLGNELIRESGSLFDRLTGLDPSGPGVVDRRKMWEKVVPSRIDPLRRDSAKWVDVIHTSNCLGTPEPLGHVDFYPNWGCTQLGYRYLNPGYLNTKSHIFAQKLFLASILHRGHFEMVRSREIRSVEKRILATVQGQGPTLGYFCAEGTQGLYYLDKGHYGNIQADPQEDKGNEESIFS